ncbi:MAG: ComEC/Rec2 family competence protein [Candidatus Paceibacterota bacterium]
MGKADNLLILCLSFVAGIFTASFFISPETGSVFLILFFVIAGLAVVGVFWQKPVVLIGFCLIIFSAGIYSYQVKFLSVSNNVLIAADGQSAVIEGRIIREPQLGYKNLKLVVSIEKVIFDSGEEILKTNKEIGKIMVYTANFRDYKYADKIKASGIISVPKTLNNFDYQGYLAKEGVVATMAYPEIIIDRSEALNFFQSAYSKVLFFKDLMRTQIQKNLPPQEGAIIAAMILGDSGLMSDEFKQKLSQTGLSHAIAISGAHIVLFSIVMFEIFLFFGLWKKQAALITIVLIILYVISVGAMASAVRSGIMACLLMAAQLFGRVGENERMLGIAGFLILLQNPLALKYDLGFQLSFLAIIGIIFVAPDLARWLNNKTNNKLKPVMEIFAATLAAQVLTLPILVFNFGYVSTIALISNMLAAPMLPILMVLGLAFPVIGIVFPLLGWVISFFCSIFLKYLIGVVDFCNFIPFGVINFKISIFAMILVYLAIFIFIIKQKNKKRDFAFFA